MTSNSPKLDSFSPQLKTSDFWLWAIAACLVAIYLTLVWRIDDSDLFAGALLFLAAVYSLLQERWKQLNLQSTLASSLVGCSLILLLLIRSTNLPSPTFLLVFPLIAGLGLALLASGFRGIRQYWRELGILLFLGLPRILLPRLIDPTLWTAKFSAVILWYLGFPVLRDGLNIQINEGVIEVYEGCSGLDSMSHLLALSGLFIFMFSKGWVQSIFVAIASLIIAFIVNAFRVALMGYLVSISNMAAFDYWHEGTGSLIFSVIAVLLFGLLCFFLIRQSEQPDDDHLPPVEV